MPIDICCEPVLTWVIWPGLESDTEITIVNGDTLANSITPQDYIDMGIMYKIRGPYAEGEPGDEVIAAALVYGNIKFTLANSIATYKPIVVSNQFIGGRPTDPRR